MTILRTTGEIERFLKAHAGRARVEVDIGAVRVVVPARHVASTYNELKDRMHFAVHISVTKFKWYEVWKRGVCTARLF